MDDDENRGIHFLANISSYSEINNLHEPEDQINRTEPAEIPSNTRTKSINNVSSGQQRNPVFINNIAPSTSNDSSGKSQYPQSNNNKPPGGKLKLKANPQRTDQSNKSLYYQRDIRGQIYQRNQKDLRNQHSQSILHFIPDQTETNNAGDKSLMIYGTQSLSVLPNQMFPNTVIINNPNSNSSCRCSSNGQASIEVLVPQMNKPIISINNYCPSSYSLKKAPAQLSETQNEGVSTIEVQKATPLINKKATTRRVKKTVVETTSNQKNSIHNNLVSTPIINAYRPWVNCNHTNGEILGTHTASGAMAYQMYCCQMQRVHCPHNMCLWESSVFYLTSHIRNTHMPCIRMGDSVKYCVDTGRFSIRNTYTYLQENNGLIYVIKTIRRNKDIIITLQYVPQYNEVSPVQGTIQFLNPGVNTSAQWFGQLYPYAAEEEALLANGCYLIACGIMNYINFSFRIIV